MFFLDFSVIFLDFFVIFLDFSVIFTDFAAGISYELSLVRSLLASLLPGDSPVPTQSGLNLDIYLPGHPRVNADTTIE